jgi:hypothetical protein
MAVCQERAKEGGASRDIKEKGRQCCDIVLHNDFIPLLLFLGQL